MKRDFTVCEQKLERLVLLNKHDTICFLKSPRLADSAYSFKARRKKETEKDMERDNKRESNYIKSVGNSTNAVYVVKSHLHCKYLYVSNLLWCLFLLLQDRRMGDSCTTQSHCNVSNPYSTCNTKTGVCECKEGYFERFNTCFPDECYSKGFRSCGLLGNIMECAAPTNKHF